MDISNIKIGTTVYSIKDPTARTSATNADNKADQAINDSAVAQAEATEAKSAAATAQTAANNANTKIDGAKITGVYTESTETIEIKLEIGEV
jgi:hypothetical protein